MVNINLAVLMTCHNRKQKTLDCLTALFTNALPATVALDVYLVDDGSTDGTSNVVCQNYPEVHVIKGNGNLYWAGGMHKAFEEAIQKEYDFYLWLNDDTILYPTALNTLLATFQKLINQGNQNVIVIGATQDPETHSLTYGGLIQNSYLHPLKFSRLKLVNDIQQCHTMNGNCVLIPYKVAKVVGNLDLAFTHYLADYDYGLRARKKGCTLWIAPDYVGTCVINDFESRKSKASFSLEHIQTLIKNQPKGLLVGDTIVYSLKEWRTFSERHGGLFWLFYWLLPYRRLILPIIQNWFK